jgi:hypothetical protein
MAKWQLDLILDQALNYIKNNTTQIVVCKAQPADYTGATVTHKLALKSGLTSSDFTGPSDGVVSGRKLIVNQQASIPITASNDGTHIALCSGSVLLYVTTNTLKGLVSGDTVTVPAWNIEFADVTP